VKQYLNATHIGLADDDLMIWSKHVAQIRLYKIHKIYINIYCLH
jgi:hypothetical protein